MEGYMWVAVGIVAFIAFYTDHTRMIIPNWLTASSALTGLLIHGVASGWSGLKMSLIGLAGSFLISFVIYLCKGFEAGDVKLFAAFGAMGGLEFSFTGLVHSLVIAAVVGLFIHFFRYIRKSGIRHTRIEFPFMYAVLPGLAVTFLTMEVFV